MLFTFGEGRQGVSLQFPVLRSSASRTFVSCRCYIIHFSVRGDRGVRVSRFLYHVLPLPYFCVPLPPDYHPWLCCSRLLVNQSLTFKLSQNLTFLFIFWSLFWREDHRTDERYYRSVFLIKLSLTWLSQFDHRFWSLSPLCDLIAIAIFNIGFSMHLRMPFQKQL